MKNKNFNLYLSGKFISLIGSGIQNIALPLYVIKMTESGKIMGLFSVITMIPVLILTPFSGVIGDRLNRKTIMISMDFFRGLLILIMSLLAFNGFMNIYIILFFQIFISSADSVFNSSTNAMVGDLVPVNELKKANAKISAVQNIALLAGPAIGGILFAKLGISVIFLINGISFILSAFSEIFISYEHNGDKLKDLRIKEFFTDIKKGIIFIINKNGMNSLFLYLMITNFLVVPVFAVGYKFIINSELHFSPEYYSLTEIGYLLGSIIGSFMCATFFSKTPGRKSIFSGLVIEAIMIFIAGLTFSPVIFIFFGEAGIINTLILSSVQFFTGIAHSFIMVPIYTYITKETSVYMRSRVFSVFNFIISSIIPIGTAFYGILLDKFSGYSIVLTIAIINIFMVLVFYFIFPKKLFD